MQRRSSAVLALVLSACGPQLGALQNQSLGKTTGLFTTIASNSAACGTLNIVTPSMDVTFILPDTEKDTLTLALQLLSTADERFQFRTALSYGVGQSTRAVVDIERGHERVSPDLSGDVAAQALATRTSLYFPVFLHTVRVEAARLCNIDPVTNQVLTDDCIDVPESSIEEARLWCSVGVNVDMRFSQ